MFCPLERIELNIDTCPAKSCMYKGSGGSCNYDRLTGDEVTVQDIAEVRSDKVYKIKAQAQSAKASISNGMMICRYADYIKEVYASQPNPKEAKGNEDQTVNTGESGHVPKVLARVFGLSTYQQHFFWQQATFNKWKKNVDVNVSLQEFRQALLTASTV